jgi:hypothetical protein
VQRVVVRPCWLLVLVLVLVLRPRLLLQVLWPLAVLFLHALAPHELCKFMVAILPRWRADQLDRRKVIPRRRALCRLGK